ncbi:MAG: hypothetical protein HAW67_05290 [Endozoicomonadaceae bacterium]|nr:hypothetical protein [Endozoicomonadaceae bacterium]
MSTLISRTKAITRLTAIITKELNTDDAVSAINETFDFTILRTVFN